MVRRKKTPQERADEQRRYALVAAATTDAELEPFLTDPNQAIRCDAAANRNASDALLARFAKDSFWGTRVAVAQHAHSSRETVLGLLETNPRSRGVVHRAARERLESEGVEFGEDQMPLD